MRFRRGWLLVVATALVAGACNTGYSAVTAWSRVPDDATVLAEAGDQWMESVTAGGPGLVAVGLDLSGGGSDGAVWTSPDGVTWSRIPDDEAVFGGAWMNDVTAGGPGLVAVGRDGLTAAVWNSADGITWSRVAHDQAVFGGRIAQEMFSVTAGGPGLVAVGNIATIDDDDAAVWTSPDGVTWSRVHDDVTVFGGARIQWMFSVTVGGPGLVAVGIDDSGGDFDAAVWTSPDGVNWSRVSHDEAVLGGSGDQSMRSVTAGGPGLVAVGRDDAGDDEDAAVWTSADGITWSRVLDDDSVLGGPGSQSMDDVTTGGLSLVAVGSDLSGGSYDAAVWVSPDGVTWSRVPDDESVFGGAGTQVMNSVTAGGPGLVAVGFADPSLADDDPAVWVEATEE